MEHPNTHQPPRRFRRRALPAAAVGLAAVVAGTSASARVEVSRPETITLLRKWVQRLAKR